MKKVVDEFVFSFVSVFQTENDTLKQMVIRDGHDKQLIQHISSNLNGSQKNNFRFSGQTTREKTDDEIQRISKNLVQSNDRVVRLINL